MRNYYSESGLRPEQNEPEEEPELQWLEDSINYLVSISFVCVGLIFRALFDGIVRICDELRKSSK
jgi:hypothetical protein